MKDLSTCTTSELPGSSKHVSCVPFALIGMKVLWCGNTLMDFTKVTLTEGTFDMSVFVDVLDFFLRPPLQTSTLG